MEARARGCQQHVDAVASALAREGGNGLLLVVEGLNERRVVVNHHHDGFKMLPVLLNVGCEVASGLGEKALATGDLIPQHLEEVLDLLPVVGTQDITDVRCLLESP